MESLWEVVEQRKPGLMMAFEVSFFCLSLAPRS